MKIDGLREILILLNSAVLQIDKRDKELCVQLNLNKGICFISISCRDRLYATPNVSTCFRLEEFI